MTSGPRPTIGPGPSPRRSTHPIESLDASPSASAASAPGRPRHGWRPQELRRRGLAGDVEMAETWMARPPVRGHHGPTMTRTLAPPDTPQPRAGARRGRLSRANRLRALQAALRRIDSAWELSQSPMAQYRDLQELGRTRFGQQAFPEGWAVQAVLRLACARVERALEPRKGDFLRRWVAGESIAGIAASAGMSRSYLSRRWRPEVLAAIDAEVANLLRELRAGGGHRLQKMAERVQ